MKIAFNRLSPSSLICCYLIKVTLWSDFFLNCNYNISVFVGFLSPDEFVVPAAAVNTVRVVKNYMWDLVGVTGVQKEGEVLR